MVSPLLGLTDLALDSQGNETKVNDGWRRLEVLATGKILDRDLTAPPGSPSEGDAYIVGSSPTGDWATHANDVTWLSGGVWKFWTPTDGVQLWLVDENSRVLWDAGLGQWLAIDAMQTLTDGASPVNWDGKLGARAKWTLGGARTLATPFSLFAGWTYTLQLVQDPTGSRTVTWPALTDFTGGTPPTLSTGPNDVDILTFFYDGTKLLEVSRALNVS